MIQLERHRRTEGHSDRSESRLGRARASWSVGPTSEVRLESVDRSVASDRLRTSLSRSIGGPIQRLVATKEVFGTTSNDNATTMMSSRAGRTQRRESRISHQTGSPFRTDQRIAVIWRDSSRATLIRRHPLRRRWDGGLVSAPTEQDKNDRTFSTVQITVQLKYR